MVIPLSLKVGAVQVEGFYILKVTYPDYPNDPLVSRPTKLVILGLFTSALIFKLLKNYISNLIFFSS